MCLHVFQPMSHTQLGSHEIRVDLGATRPQLVEARIGPCRLVADGRGLQQSCWPWLRRAAACGDDMDIPDGAHWVQGSQ